MVVFRFQIANIQGTLLRVDTSGRIQEMASVGQKTWKSMSDFPGRPIGFGERCCCGPARGRDAPKTGRVTKYNDVVRTPSSTGGRKRLPRRANTPPPPP